MASPWGSTRALDGPRARWPRRRRDCFEIDPPGLRLLLGPFDQPYPFAKYDQLFVPEFNAGAMENVGAVTFHDGLPVPRPAHRDAAPDAGRGRPPRARPHVVRRPRDHALVGRPVAERELRHLHQLSGPDRGDALHQRLEVFNGDDQALRLPAGPAAHHAPHRRPTSPTPSGVLNFDGITYGKGASVLKQLVATIGPKSSATGCAPTSGARLGERDARATS